MGISKKIKYIKILNNQNLDKKIKLILNYNKPVICDLIMDNSQDQIPKAINKRNQFGQSVPTTFEDMYPFLDKKQIDKSTYSSYIKTLNKGKKI